MRTFKLYLIVPLLAGLLAAALLPSCKRYYDIPPFFEENKDTLKLSSRKVLIIGIDGAVGSEYKTIQPPVLNTLKAHSKFSWEGISDEATSDAASWKTLMTGVSFSRHRIQDSSFIYTQPAGSSEHDAPSVFPAFFSYILGSAKADLKTSFITSWGTLLDRLVPEVEDKVLASGDAAVRDSALVRVKNPRSDLIVVHFNGVAGAGKTHGFSAAAPGYKEAVLQVDQYIGELLAALKNRPEYNRSEEWLVIVTGTHGGEGNSYGGPSEKETNVISFFYNENLKPVEFTKGGAFAGVEFKGRDAAAVKGQVLNDGGLYNMGIGQQTIELKIKGPGPGAYPHFFSKMNKWPSTPGWSMFTSGQTWAISVRSETSGERRIQAATPNVFNNQWHTLSVVLYDSAGSRWIKRFTDGVRVADVTATVNLGAGYGTIASPAPLMLGWGADPGFGAVSFYAADVRIFNTALSDQEVRDNLCLLDITRHPKYTNLIGYWPGNDGFGGRLRNKAPGRNLDFSLQGPFQWTGVPELPCTIAAVPANPAVTPLLVKGVDIVTTALYWLRIPTLSSWGLEGSTWLEKYDVEFVKL